MPAAPAANNNAMEQKLNTFSSLPCSLSLTVLPPIHTSVLRCHGFRAFSSSPQSKKANEHDSMHTGL